MDIKETMALILGTCAIACIAILLLLGIIGWIGASKKFDL